MSPPVWCDVAFSHPEVPLRLLDAERARGAAPGGVVCAVIDVLRATSTIVAALGNGCRAVHPCPSPDAAREKAKALRAAPGGGGVLLGGEQDGAPIAGFDSGNSPLEYTPEVIGGRTLVLSTSNGTKALAAAAACGAAYIVSLGNLSAAAGRLAARLSGSTELAEVSPKAAALGGEGARTLLVACSGRERGYCEDDTLVAGLLLDTLAGRLGSGRVELSDTARAAVRVARGAGADLARVLLDSFWGRHLIDLGMEEDIRFCARRDWTDAVPVLRNGVIEAG